MTENAKKPAVIVNEEGSTMIEIKGLRVEGDRIVIRGALMGAWDTDMYMDVDSVKAAVGLVPFDQMVPFALDKLMQVKVTKVDE
jgi:hypothetical protein